MNFSIVILVVALCVAAAALREILTLRRELTRFEAGLQRLPGSSFPVSTVFPAGYESCRLANEFLSLCSRAAERQMLSVLNLERSSAPLYSYFRSRVNTPRTLAGVLVLCGLLVTLLNLQGSVGRLGTSFQNLSSNQAEMSQSTAVRSIKEIQGAMGEIAGRAHDAFLQSFIVIAMAAGILALTLQINNRAQRASRQFAVWANSAHMESVVSQPAVRENQVEKLGELISKLAEVAGGFEGMGAAMASVGDLGSKLDASSQIVAEAVHKLPDTINASVGQLSVEVTRDISAHLEHQIEHLKKILAIYGDQELRVKKVQEYLDQMGDSTKEAMQALKGLSTLPAKIDSLSDAVRDFNMSTATFQAACSALDTKIENVPTIDLSRIEAMVTLVNGLTTDVREFTKSAPGLIAGGVDSRLERVQSAMQELAARNPAASIAKLQDELGALKAALNGFQPERMLTLAADIEKLVHENRRRGLFGIFGQS